MKATARTEIADLASTLRESLELSSPIDVVSAVERLGGVVMETATLDDSMEALVRKCDDAFEIVLLESKPPLRKRFSVAHELGHLFLHMGYLVNPALWASTSEYKDSVYYRFGYGVEEDEANEFAAAFLMPEKEFKASLAQHRNEAEKAINALSEKFGVSKDAVLTRGRYLGLFSN